MRLIRHVLGCEPEVVDGIDAIVLLFHNEKGTFCFVKGLGNIVHDIFLEGSLRWPFLGWEDKTRKAIIDVLGPRRSENTREVLNISRELASGTYGDENYKGAVLFFIHGIAGGAVSSLIITEVDDALLFLSRKGETLVAADGWGTEKTELMFYGAEILFSKEVSDELREAVYGKVEFELSDGRKGHLDLTSFYSKILGSSRANKAREGQVILTAEAWKALAEEKAREENVPPSLN